MMKQIKWPIWLIILCLFLGLTVVFAILIQNITHDEPVTVQVNSKQIDSGIKLQTETKESNSFTTSVTYPYTNIEAIDLPIREWASQQEESFFDEMEQIEMVLDEQIKAHFNIQTDIYKTDDNIYSFVMTSEQSVDNINEYSLLNTFTIDLDSETIIELNDILHIDEINQEELITLFMENMNDQKMIDELDENRLKTVIHNLNQVNFELNEDSVNFYFNPAEIGSHQQVTSVNIPIILIHDYIKENFKPILISDEIAEEISKQPRELAEDGKYIALTFDDGPSDSVTPKILKTLKKYDAKATFFMLGQNATNYPEIAKQVADEGHEIANHSVSHANLNAVSGSKIKTEMIDSISQIEKATGEIPVTFRPPYGEFNKTVIEHATESDQSIIMWSVDTLDWKYRNANTIFDKTKNAKPGSIVLMHDIHPTTADALPKIMKYLSDEGFEFVTVTELLPIIEGEGVGPYYGE